MSNVIWLQYKYTDIISATDLIRQSGGPSQFLDRGGAGYYTMISDVGGISLKSSYLDEHDIANFVHVNLSGISGINPAEINATTDPFANNSKEPGDTFWVAAPIAVPDNYIIPSEFKLYDFSVDPITEDPELSPLESLDEFGSFYNNHSKIAANSKLSDILLIREQIEIEKQYLDALNSENSLQLFKLGLQTASLAGEYAGLLMPASSPGAALAKAYILMKGAQSTQTLIDSTKELFSEPSIVNIQHFQESAANFLVDATGYAGSLGNLLGTAAAVRSSMDLYKNGSDYFGAGQNQIKQNIDLTTARINELEEARDKIESDVNFRDPDLIPKIHAPLTLRDTPNLVEFSNAEAVVAYGFDDKVQFNFDEIGAGKILSFSFTGDAQSGSTTGGISIIDGSGVKGDLVALPGVRADYAEVHGSDTDIMFSKAGLESIMTGVDRIQFADGILATDTGSGDNAGNAYRIYKAIFDREPDQQGLDFWTRWLDEGKTDPYNMAGRFIDSNEFRALYGSSNPANDVFLTTVYSNVLDRAPDQDGYVWWLDQLNTGSFSPSDVLARFSDSVENRENVADQIEDGIFLTNEYFTF